MQQSHPQKYYDYDVIVIGAGIAGLTAGYYLANSGISVVIFEHYKEPGTLDHPCGGMVGAVPGYIHFERRQEGIYFKEVDFLFSKELISGYPNFMKFVASDGSYFEMHITNNHSENAPFQVHKPALLRELHLKAKNAGARIQYEAKVSKLHVENDTVKGIVLNDKIITAKIVLSTEGLSRHFTNVAGLYSSKPQAYIYIHSIQYDNVKLSPADLGQVGYFGEKVTSLPRSSIMSHSLGDQSIMIILSVYLEEMKWPYKDSISEYLEEAVQKIPEFQKYVEKGVKKDSKGCWMTIQKPSTLIKNGFIGAGDSVAPMGHSSIAIAMLMGKEAALSCIGAIQKSDISVNMLKKYNKHLSSKLFKGVEFEAKLIVAMLNFSDEDLNKIIDALSGINLEPFFIGTSTQQIFAAFKLIFKKKVIKNWKLIKQLF